MTVDRDWAFTVDRGWAFTSPGSRKAHYFRGDGRSLCGKHDSRRIPDWAFEADSPDPRDSCGTCQQRLDKQGLRAESAGAS